MGLDDKIIKYPYDIIFQPIVRDKEDDPFRIILEKAKELGATRENPLEENGENYFVKDNILNILKKEIVFLKSAKNIDNYFFIKSKVKSTGATPESPIPMDTNYFCIYHNRLHTLHYSLEENKPVKNIYEGFSKEVEQKMEDAKKVVEALYEKERLSEAKF